jgi:hypothetical protein
MNKGEVISLLREVAGFCEEIANSQTVAMDSLPTGEVELKVKCKLGSSSRKTLNEFIAKRKLAMREEKDFVVIFSPDPT